MKRMIILLAVCLLLAGVVKAVEISFTLTSADAARLVDAFCERGDYEENKQDGETRQEFARRMHRDLLKRIVQSIEEREAKEEAAALVETIAID